jgi:hypothetical protein
MPYLNYTPKQQERYAIADAFRVAGGTLDGQDANICGMCHEHATVVALEGGQSAQYAWTTLDRRIKAGNVDLEY